MISMCSVSKMMNNSFLRRHFYICGNTCLKVNFIEKTVLIMKNQNFNVNTNVNNCDNYNNGRTMNVKNDTFSGKQINDNFLWLEKSAPGFLIDSSTVTIINEPKIFYSVLLAKIKSAQRRIILASLYLGTGELEKNLVNAIEKSLIRSNGGVKINILLDYMRGTRGINNSVKMLEPLKDKYSANCTISLYHTPKLRGLLKMIIPKRFNELIGLQHMKIYIFDNSIIISGANLSNDYFVNRQDRYFLIDNCKELSNFYSELIHLVSKYSFQLLPNSELLPPASLVDSTSDSSIKNLQNTPAHSTRNSKSFNPSPEAAEKFVQSAHSEIKSFYLGAIKKSQENQQRCDKKCKLYDTWIFPLIQMGQLGIFYDCEITQRLLKTAPKGSDLKLATGYFNLTTEYSNALLWDCQATSCTLLTAHPTTNGFYGAKGIAGKIPAAYTIIERSFFNAYERMNLSNRIKLFEFIRPGWTYHAKGLWYTLPNENKPSFTLIGSSNFGYRSVNRDLETQIALVTQNSQLQCVLQDEYDRLHKYSTYVTRESLSHNEKMTPAWVYAAVFLFRYFF